MLCRLSTMDTVTTEIATRSLHDPLPILPDGTTTVRWTYETDSSYQGRGIYVDGIVVSQGRRTSFDSSRPADERSEEHTSELQSPCKLVCRLLLEKKNIKIR